MCNQLLYDSLSSQLMKPSALVKKCSSGYSLRAGCSYLLPKGFLGPLVSRIKAHNLDGSMRFLVWNVLPLSSSKGKLWVDVLESNPNLRTEYGFHMRSLAWSPVTCRRMYTHMLALMGTLFPLSDPCHFDCWDGCLTLIMSAYSIRTNHHETLFHGTLLDNFQQPCAVKQRE